MSVEISELRQVVRTLTGSSQLGPWQSETLAAPIVSATVGIWRVHGQGWSTVLKLIGHSDTGHRNWRSGERCDHWYYWRREVLAYQSGLLSSFDGGLRAPECYLVAERFDGSVAVWLEDLTRSSPATDWSVGEYGPAMRDLGRAQGQFLGTQSLPEAGWLSRRWLRSYLTQRDSDTALLERAESWATPLAKRYLNRSLAAPLIAMRRDQEAFLLALEGMAPTICHLDLHPANMYATPGHTVLIDWSFVGVGSIGEDPGNLVPDAVLDFHVAPDHVDQLDAAVHAGYVAGLRDDGWRGSDATVRLAMDATVAAKYSWIAPAMLRAGLDRRETVNGRPSEEAFGSWAPTVLFLLRCAERARTRIAAG